MPTHTSLNIFAIVAALTVLVTGPLDAVSSAAPSQLDFDAPPQLVIGLPMPLRVVVQGPADLPHASLLDDISPFRVRLTGQDKTYYLREKMRRVIYDLPEFEPDRNPRTIPVPQDRIENGQANEYLLDLSQFELNEDTTNGWRRIAFSELKPGAYTIEIVKAPVPFEIKSVSVQLLQPNEQEQRLLDRVEQIRMESPTWGEPKPTVWWTLLARADALLDDIRIDQLSDTGRQQLRYHLLLANLVHASAPIPELSIDPTLIEGLWPGFKTEIEMIRYEIQSAGNQPGVAGETAKLILRDRPAAQAELNTITQSGGVLARLREATAKFKGEDSGE